MKPIIAIDGPAGAGKSTVARAVAHRLRLTYIDTGAMYRGVALLAARAGIAPDDERGLTDLARSTRFAFVDGDAGRRVLVNGEDVTEAIRGAEATRLSSTVSAVPGVRRALVAVQQAMGCGGGVVMEGRDIGTVVFPQADVKVFLTASAEERARRRWLELQERGDQTSLEAVLASQRERDARDSSREDSPLAAAPDAVTLVTDGLSLSEVVDRIVGLASSRGGAA